VALKFSPDARIFFNEKDTGNIRIILQNGTLLSTPFAKVSPIFNGGEAGLLGIALDPSFSSNGYVYVFFNYETGNHSLTVTFAAIPPQETLGLIHSTSSMS